MRKKYTSVDYEEQANIANIQRKYLYVYVHEENNEQVAELVIADRGYYICYESNYTNGTINPNYEQEKQEAERQALDLLSLTKREVFLALYRAKGITPEQLRSQITDIEAQIEFDYAELYYRGNPLINTIGAMLGFTPNDLDYLFKYKSFPVIVPPENEEE